MKAPTQKEICDEIATLQKMKPAVIRTSAFGDNHHNAIDAQIAVLEDKMDEDAVYEKYDDDEDNVKDAALEAAQWLAGESENGAPSNEWKLLVR